MNDYRPIADTPDYLVVEKPAGVLTHGGPHLEGASLAASLAADHPEILTVGDDPRFRPGIVHRLDRDVSGLLVVARTRPEFERLKDLFIGRRIEKRYLALTHGRVAADAITIDFPIERRAGSAKMSALPKTKRGDPQPEGRQAHTECRVLRRFINHTLLDVRIMTGRPHQIRCHLAAYGAPLVGDDLYGTPATKRRNAKLGLGRIFLHAYRLAFDDRGGVRQTYTCPLPAALQKFLNEIK
jgi:RluA family pseudouridine synthase